MAEAESGAAKKWRPVASIFFLRRLVVGGSRTSGETISDVKPLDDDAGGNLKLSLPENI